MGIQSNLSNLSLNVLRAVKTIAGISGEEGAEPKTTKPSQPAKGSSQEGYTFLPEKKQRNPYNKALKSANNYIVEKNLSKSFNIDERIKMAQEATQFSAIDKGGNE